MRKKPNEAETVAFAIIQKFWAEHQEQVMQIISEECFHDLISDKAAYPQESLKRAFRRIETLADGWNGKKPVASESGPTT